MDGVTILYTELVEATYGPGWDSWGAVLGLFAIMCFILTLILANRIETEIIVFPLLGICLLLSMTGSLIRFTNSVVETPEHYEYKVLIDDAASLAEFNEKYEIIDREGAIYTVIEKESE